jgi:hypothetical protein
MVANSEIAISTATYGRNRRGAILGLPWEIGIAKGASRQCLIS